MGTIFNLDSPVWSFMGKVADLVILNIIAIICSIPIFTIGATWTAVYFVTIRIVRKEEGYVIRDFFRSFKENFKQATIIWILALIIGAIILVDILIYRVMPDKMPQIVMIVVSIFAFLMLGTTAYVFPLLSRFHNTIKNTIKNAFILSIANVPYTILFIVLLILPFVLLDFLIVTLFLLFEQSNEKRNISKIIFSICYACAIVTFYILFKNRNIGLYSFCRKNGICCPTPI